MGGEKQHHPQREEEGTTSPKEEEEKSTTRKGRTQAHVKFIYCDNLISFELYIEIKFMISSTRKSKHFQIKHEKQKYRSLIAKKNTCSATPLAQKEEGGLFLWVVLPSFFARGAVFLPPLLWSCCRSPSPSPSLYVNLQLQEGRPTPTPHQDTGSSVLFTHHPNPPRCHGLVAALG